MNLSRDVRLPTPSRETLAAGGAMLALGLVLYRDCVFFGRALFQRDIDLFWYGNVEAAVRTIGAGSLPLWNPYPAFGQPMLAVAIGQLLYPTTWLNLLLAPDRYYALFAVLHVMVAGLGGYVLARRLSASWLAGTTAGLLWASCGPFQSLVHMANMYAACAWLPWAWAAAHATLVEGRRAAAVGWGVTLALTILAGSPEATLMAAAGAVIALPERGLGEWRRVALGRLGLGLLAGGLGLGLSGAQWLPTLEMHRHSARESIGSAIQLYWSNHPIGLVQTFLPVPFDDLPLAPLVRDEMYQGHEPFLFSIYLGLAALPLVAAGLLEGRGRARWALGALGAIAALLSLGRYSPLYDAARAVLPPLQQVRFPSKFTLLFALPFALLAGLGVDALAAAARSRKRWVALVVVPAGVLAAFAVLSAPADAAVWKALLVTPEVFGKPLEASPAFRATQGALLRAALLGGLSALLALVRLTSPLPARALAVLCAALAVADSVAGLPGLNPTVPRELLGFRPAVVEAVPHARPNRTLVLDYEHPPVSLRWLGRLNAFAIPFDVTPEQVFLFGRVYPFASLGGGLWGIEGFGEDIPLLRDRQVARLHTLLQTAPGRPSYLRLLQLAGVQYLATLHEAELPPELQLLGRFPTPHGTAARLFRVPDPLPRAYAVAGARVAEGAEALRRMVEPGFDPRAEIVLPPGTAARAPKPLAAEVALRRSAPDHVVIDARLDGPGYVVLLEGWAPGWTALVDGRPAEVLRANTAFRAVAVESGTHAVEMRYRPRSVGVGGLVSLASLAVAGALLRAPRR